MSSSRHSPHGKACTQPRPHTAVPRYSIGCASSAHHTECWTQDWRAHLHIAVGGSHAHHGSGDHGPPTGGARPGGGPDGQRGAALNGGGRVRGSGALAALCGGGWRLCRLLRGVAGSPERALAKGDLQGTQTSVTSCGDTSPAATWHAGSSPQSNDVWMGAAVTHEKVKTVSAVHTIAAADCGMLHNKMLRHRCWAKAGMAHLCMGADGRVRSGL